MTKPTSDLLPRNATPFERAVVNSARFDLLNGLVDAARGIKHDIHENVAPWLAAEWFLSDFAPYFDTTAALIDAGLPWLRMRGTAAAVKLALSWIGFTAEVEEDEAYLHIDPGSPHAPARLDDIKLLINRSIPAHVLFYRLFHGYDLRHVVLDRSRLDDSILDDDSGITIDGIKMSFGRNHGVFIPQDDDTDFYHARSSTTRWLSWDDDSWRLDSWRLDSAILIDSAGALISMRGHIIDWQDDTLSAVVRTRMFGGFVPADDLPVYYRHTASHGATLLRMRRGWTGRWAGPWRDPVHIHHFQETN